MDRNIENWGGKEKDRQKFRSYGLEKGIRFEDLILAVKKEITMPMSKRRRRWECADSGQDKEVLLLKYYDYYYLLTKRRWEGREEWNETEVKVC